MWVNYPNMPTGARATEELFEQLVAFARRNKILLVHDNPYSFILSEPRSLLSVPGAREVVLELNSLSKSHNMAGWRIGALLGRPDYLQAVLRFKSNMDSGQFKPMQMASIRALSLSDEWYERQNAIYRARRKVAAEILTRLGCTFDTQQSGLFLWAKVPESFADGYAFSDWLLHEKHIFLAPGGIFGDQGSRYVRISLCSTEKMLKTALDRVSEHRLKPVNPQNQSL
jgi:aspartate/methionine/tyrosine aminotransferase